MKTTVSKIIDASFIAGILLTSCNNQPTGNGKGGNTAYIEKHDSISTSSVKNPDNDFVLNAAKGGMMEIELGKIASQKGQNVQVKAFGDMMVTDHTKAGNELKKIADSRNVTLPDSVSSEQQKMIDGLAEKSGGDFDKAYIDMMVNDHKEDINDFKSEADEGKDSAFKAFAASTLPVLQKHLHAAKAAQKALGNK